MKIRCFPPLLGLVCALVRADVPGRAFDRFITIWLENQDSSKVEQNVDIKNLTDSGILLTSYYGLTHPSQPNYIASVGGDYFGLNDDDQVNIAENISTVVDLFDTKGITWREYLEDIPGPGFMGATSSNSNGQLAYVRKHKYVPRQLRTLVTDRTDSLQSSD